MVEDELEPIEPVDPADMALPSPEEADSDTASEEPDVVEPSKPTVPTEPMEDFAEPADVSEEPMPIVDADLEPAPEEVPEPVEPSFGEEALVEPLPEEQAPEGEASGEGGGAGGAGGGLLKTGRGRTIAVAVLAVAVLGALVACVIFVSIILPMLMGGKQTPTKAPGPVKTIEGKGKTGKTKPAAEESPEELVESFEVYEYKDPFRPLVVDEVTTTRPVSSAGTTSDTFTGSGGLGMAPGGGADNLSSLALKDIYDKGGKTYVLVSYAGKSYTVAQGDRIGKSPYQVLAVGKDGATMLFGDDRLNIYLGQVIVK